MYKKEVGILKKEDIKPFFETYDDDFFDSMNDVKKYLKDNNEEYKKITTLK